MKLRFAALITILGACACAGFGQRTMHTETKASASTTSSHSEVANEAARARRSLALRSNAQAARFQQVAVALNLTNHQKSSIGSLVRQTRQQLSVINANGSLGAEQQQQAEQAAKLGLAQKFVGLLTPEQKHDLLALLLKKKQQQDANANSSAGSSGVSAPDIPSVDAPSGSDSSDPQDASSAQNANSDASANGSTTASTPTDPNASSSGSSAAGQTVSASAATSSTPATQVASAKADAASSASANAKPGRLSDAQLAAILNSFVQDGSDTAATKSASSAVGSSS